MRFKFAPIHLDCVAGGRPELDAESNHSVIAGAVEDAIDFGDDEHAAHDGDAEQADEPDGGGDAEVDVADVEEQHAAHQ